MSRVEAEKSLQHSPNTPPHSYEELTDAQKQVVELAQFLQGAPIDVVRINSVISSTRTGLIMNFTLGKFVGVTEGEEQVVNLCTVDGSAVKNLSRSIDLMNKKDKKKHKDVIKSLKALRIYLENPFNWSDQFNTEKES